MRVGIAWLVILAFAVAAPMAQTGPPETLDIYMIDVEGGAANLYVAPSGETLLIDTGNASNGRDADRIMAAVHAAGVRRIDHLIITHFHGDHIGGLVDLAARIPIRHFIDHGENSQPNPGMDALLQGPYRDLYMKARRTVAKPGDRIPVAGLDVRVVKSDGETIATPLAGAGQANPACATFEPQDDNISDDNRSVSSVITFGRFRVAQMGDLVVNEEFELMCPNNRIGKVDVFMASGHGAPRMNSAALVHAIQPRVVLMNNGTRKGGQPETMKILFSSPGLENIWQLHLSLFSGQEYAVPGLFTANTYDSQPLTVAIAPVPEGARGPGAPPNPVPAPPHNGKAFYLKVSAQQDGTFTVTNTRNGFSKTYRARDR
jgi:beta-lactamase superfamily II metal-dependent hydrolase